MCEVLDAIEKRGFDQGEEAQARKDAVAMRKNGFAADKIAAIIDRDIETVLHWLNEAETG